MCFVMFANPDELALRVVSEYKEQNFSDLKNADVDDKEYYYSRWALDEISLCILCSNVNGPPSRSVKKFQEKLKLYLDNDCTDESSRLIFTTAYKVTCDILELLECYQYEYFTVM